MLDNLQDSLQNAGNILLAVLGISFLIFMHELGHFLAARLFAVRVEIFSIGFGPRIFGRRRGDTDYRISIVPLGGYVKMAGEYTDIDAATPSDGSDLLSKPIWQRLVIFLAGPLMNLALAFVMFPAAFGGGVPFIAPVVGGVDPGGPAWVAGLRSGDEILSINGSRIYGFSDVFLEVALGNPAGVLVHIRRDGQESEVHVVPTRRDGRYDIGISPPQSPVLTVVEDGPAAQAGLRTGDVLVAMAGRQVGAQVADRRLAPLDVWMSALEDGRPVEVLAEREGRTVRAVVEPLMVTEDAARPQVGAAPLETRVSGLRRAAAEPDFPLRPGDVLLRGGTTPLFTADDVQRAATEARAAGGLDLLIHRDGRRIPLRLDAPAVATLLAGDVALGHDSSGTPAIRPLPGGPLAEAGLVAGDELISLNDTPVHDFDELRDVLAADAQRVDFVVRYRRDGETRTASVRARPLPQADLGLELSAAQIVHEMSLWGALVAGFDASVNTLRTTGLTLSKLFTGEVSTDNLGGPLQIGVITFEAATRNLAKLLFILALLSVNLGFINLLPIPVLDGGQILFLLCEKIKGSRLSERFMQNAQLAGFVAILALMVYVTVNDILRISE